jgi:energy-coupling factor transporter ATP-binding protein EcfA2
MANRSVFNLLPRGSWFREYLACYDETVESPRSFMLFSVMALMGTALGRKVWMDYDVHKIRPMLNVLLIGPSGIGKSTSVKMTRELLSRIEVRYRPQFIEGGTTKEKLHSDLAENPHAIIFASELAAFFSKETYKEGLIPYVTQLLDYEDQIELRTRKNGIEIIENPEVSIVGASTREWLQDMLPNSAVSGGFLARFLLLFENERAKRIPNPQLISRPARERLHARREALKDSFGKIMEAAFRNGERPITYADYDASDAYALWYRAYNSASGLLAPFAARAGEMILRLCILNAIACGRYEITEEDVKCSINLYEYTAAKLGTIITPVSQSGRLLATVLDAIPPEGICRQDLYRSLRSVANFIEIGRSVQSLVASADVTEDLKTKVITRTQ